MEFENTMLSVSEGVTAAELDGELVLLNVNTGQYFGLNEVGAVIFQKLNSQKSYSELLGNLLKEFDVKEKILINELNSFLEEMIKNDLIEVGAEANV